MCISPSAVWVKRGPKWVETPVPCDRCWVCRENYVSDWVGRCLCEAATSQVACTLSLTYAPPRDPNDQSHRILNPSHFQLFMKRLRNAGHKVRYLVAGEYGDLKSRAHFHVILFFSVLRDVKQGDPHLMDRVAFQDDPSIASKFSRQMPNKSMCHIAEWPHGHVECDWSMDEKAVRYCTAYLYQDGKKTGWSSMSKKPPLGFAWFAEKARRSVDWGVFPSTFEYLPPGGKPGKRYLMTGATRRDFLNLITLDRADRPRMSKWVQATFDKLERQDYVKSSVKGAPWPDDYFAAWQAPVEAVRARIAEEDKWGEGGFRGRVARMMEADAQAGRLRYAPGRVRIRDRDPKGRYWNVPKKHLWYEAAVAFDFGQCSFPFEGQSAPYFSESWVELYFQAGNGSPKARARFASHRKRAPDWYDRQGRPQWGAEGRQNFASAFAREAPGEGGQSDPSGGLQEDTAQE